MITMTFLKTWFRWLLTAAGVLLVDYVVVQNTVWRVGIAAVVLLVFGLVTAVLYSDWKRARHGAGYRYSILDDRD